MSGICPCTMGNSVSQALFNLKNVKKLNCDTPEQTSPATVLSRKVQRTNEITMFQENPWLYLVTFRLENGEELELNTTEETYSLLKDSTLWQITWQEDRLIACEKKEEGRCCRHGSP